MRADPETAAAIRALVERTYAAMSTPGSDFTELFGADDMTVSGSGQGEILDGPEVVCRVAAAIASQGAVWRAEEVTVWQQHEVAWARVLGHVEVGRETGPERVPYWTTGVFGRSGDGWRWLHWGGSEPQEHPRV